MPSQILEPTALAGISADVTIAAGSTNTVAIFQGLSSDNLKLPDGISDFLLSPISDGSSFLLPDGVSDFLLPDGVSQLLISTEQSFLLLPQANQSSKILDKNDWADIQLKDPDGEYQSSGLQLRHNGKFKTLGPGVWRIVKPATPREFGFQSE